MRAIFFALLFATGVWAQQESPTPYDAPQPLRGVITPSDTSVFLRKAANLSDVASASTSRTNLGLGTGNSPTFTGLTLTGTGTAAAFNIGGASLGGSFFGVRVAANANFYARPSSDLGVLGGVGLDVLNTAGDTVKALGIRGSPLALNPNSSNCVSIGTTLGACDQMLQMHASASPAFHIEDGTNDLFLAIATSGNAFSNGSTAGEVIVRGNAGVGFSANGGGATQVHFTTTGITTTGSLTTGAPNGGTAGAWKGGTLETITCALSATRGVRLDIGGTSYPLATCASF